MLPAKGRDLQVETDDESAIKSLALFEPDITQVWWAHPEDTYYDVGRNLEIMPISIIRNLKQDQFASAEGIHRLRVEVRANLR